MVTTQETGVSLGQSLFGSILLGDKRWTKRAVKAFDQMQRHPGGTLPQKLGSPADLEGFYDLCKCKKFTHSVVIAAAREHALKQIGECPGRVLLLHDATELDYTTITSLEGHLGQIGKGRGRGFICQNVLAVAAESGEVLGIMDQILHRRDQVPKGESTAEHRTRETRESLLWLRGTQHLPTGRRFVDVADQGSDTFEFLEHEERSGRGFVLRAHKVRSVYAGHVATGPRYDLKQYAHRLPELGRFTMDVQPQKKRVARHNAEFIVRGGPVLVCPPQKRLGIHGDKPLALYVVVVTEVNPPPGAEAIEWTLLTNEKIENFEDAWRVIGWYEKRWVIEEFHKGQKTGCQIEDMQITKIDRLEPAIAMLSIVALTLLNLRDLSRHPSAKTRKATTILSPTYVEVLSLWRHKKVCLDWTIDDFYHALARLGGHQNRKSAPPGWIVLWRGWTQLQSILIGFEAAQRKKM
jgi:hypothetical protein